MNESIVIKFLYKTVVGRFLLKFLVNPSVSRVLARFLKSSFSRGLVPIFIKKNHIDMHYYEISKGGYRSFNDFFTRHMKKEYIWKSDEKLVCPCDGLLTVTDINEDSIFYIKHTKYHLKELLKSDEMTKEYQGGTAFIFRLTPAHYHRYIWTTSGEVCARKHIPGVLHSVQPVCHDRTPVFIQNTRQFVVINNSQYGKVLQMEVGALLVGKISNHEIVKHQVICAGQEKGFFEYGGSTIVVLTKNRITMSSDICNRDKFGNEIPVIIGESLVHGKEEREVNYYGN